MNYAAATTWLKSRNNLPTALGSAELSALDSSVRVSSFFSAKVAEARILDRLREVSDRYSRGELDRTSARAALKVFLGENGYKADDVAANPPDGVKRKDWDRNNAITNLASTGRLNLILDQNFRMAAAVGQYQVSMDPDIAERWPNYRYITGPNPRDSHAALDGFVAKKTDPIWSRIFPPWAFRCNCSVEDCDDDEAADFGGVKSSVNGTIENNGRIMRDLNDESGYTFNPAEAFKLPGMENVPEAYRDAVKNSMISFAEKEKIPAEMLENIKN